MSANRHSKRAIVVDALAMLRGVYTDVDSTLSRELPAVNTTCGFLTSSSFDANWWPYYLLIETRLLKFNLYLLNSLTNISELKLNRASEFILLFRPTYRLALFRNQPSIYSAFGRLATDSIAQAISGATREQNKSAWCEISTLISTVYVF